MSTEKLDETLDERMMRNDDARELTQHNMDIPVFRLPPELMAQIFSYCVPSPDSAYGGLKWLYITHVCRRWRIIALEYAPLWTYIELRHPKLAETMVERSKTAILSLHTPWYFPMTRDAWQCPMESLQRQLFRLGHLSLRLYVSTRMEPLVDFVQQLTQSAPLLRSIEIHSSPMLDLPHNFIAHNAPLLRHLHLKYTYLPWNSALLSNLTHLDLLGDGQTNIPTAEQLLRVLRAMPKLEVLALSYVFPDGMDRLAEIVLPRLRELRLSGNIGGCEGVLNNIVFPETTVLNLSCAIEQNDIDPFYSFLSHFPRIFRAHSSSIGTHGRTEKPRTVKTLLIHLLSSDDTPCLTFSAWNEDTLPLYAFEYGPDFVKLPAPSIHMTLQWDPEQALADVEEDLETIFSSLPMHSVETLHLRGIRDYDLDEEGIGAFLVRHLGTLPFNSTGVKTIVVSGDALHDELSEICDMLRRIDPSVSPAGLAFPVLHTLVLTSSPADFWRLAPHGGPTDMAVLLEMLAHRFGSGKRIEVLMARCFWLLRAEEVGVLREVVGELTEFPEITDLMESGR
ncbi:hypothetical protein VNI00_004556 [Paramarasmius palmivorus]|uniref:F-box domain-containing protein n=1 Tax=Paramarasmius palmivorus TaxID=297713 RepID=A0AAW0DI21_9AGAR